MCGIAVVLAAEAGAVSGAELERALVELDHRGPDARATLVLDEGRLGMAATRLAINDLEAGPQPFFNEDRSVVALVNGELYDFVERARWLRERGHVLRSHCDAELVVHLYEEYGLDFARELDGDFAVVIWDAKLRRLVAARDRMGVRPLFLARTPGRVALASEAKALFALGVRARLSADYLHGHLLGAYDGHGCAFAGVESLPPASVWTSSAGVETQRVYWRWPSGASELDQPTPSELDAALVGSVARRLRSDARTGVLMSGGLDSALVAALARAQTELPAFTLGFDHPRFDESALAGQHAARLGLPLEIVRVGAQELAEQLPETVAALEFAPINAHSVGRRLLARHVRSRGIAVVLTGEGSDELFAGYPFFLAEARWRAGLAEPSRDDGLGAGLLRDALTRAPASPFAWASFLDQRSRNLDEVPSRILTPAWRRGSRPSDRALAGLDLAALGRSPALLASRALALRQLQDYLIPALGDRVEMAHAVEGRPIFLDRAVIDIAGRSDEPSLLDLDRDQGKLLLRRAVARHLPPELAMVRKRPFLAPSWRYVLDSDAGRGLLDRHLGRRALGETGVFDPVALAFVQQQWRRLDPDRAAGHRFDWLVGLVLGVQILIARFDAV